MYTEKAALMNQLEECRKELEAAKEAHAMQLQQMEKEEFMAQKQLRAEMVHLEDQLSQVRREYEMLRVEFEQNLAANEQSGPLNKEMRQLLAGFKMQNQSFKAEAARFKRKWKEAVSLVAKTQKDLDQERKAKENAIVIPLSLPLDEEKGASDEKEGETSEAAATQSNSANQVDPIAELSESDDEAEAIGEDQQSRMNPSKKIKELKKKCAELQAELEAYKNLSADEQEKAQVISGFLYFEDDS